MALPSSALHTTVLIKYTYRSLIDDSFLYSSFIKGHFLQQLLPVSRYFTSFIHNGTIEVITKLYFNYDTSDLNVQFLKKYIVNAFITTILKLILITEQGPTEITLALWETQVKHEMLHDWSPLLKLILPKNKIIRTLYKDSLSYFSSTGRYSMTREQLCLYSIFVLQQRSYGFITFRVTQLFHLSWLCIPNNAT